MAASPHLEGVQLDEVVTALGGAGAAFAYLHGSVAAGDRQTLVDEELRLGHVKYLFFTLMEACIDAAQHVCASEGRGPPDSNAGGMVVLARNGMLPAELRATMADGVRFRNVLVDDGLD